jgi:hypothetical protein
LSPGKIEKERPGHNMTSVTKLKSNNTHRLEEWLNKIPNMMVLIVDPRACSALFHLRFLANHIAVWRGNSPSTSSDIYCLTNSIDHGLKITRSGECDSYPKVGEAGGRCQDLTAISNQNWGEREEGVCCRVVEVAALICLACVE